MGLGHGHGQWLMVSVQDQSPPLHEVLERPEGGEDGKKLAVERAVPFLPVREPPAEEGEWLEMPPDVLV